MRILMSPGASRPGPFASKFVPASTATLATSSNLPSATRSNRPSGRWTPRSPPTNLQPRPFSTRCVGTATALDAAVRGKMKERRDLMVDYERLKPTANRAAQLPGDKQTELQNAIQAVET